MTILQRILSFLGLDQSQAAFKTVSVQDLKNAPASSRLILDVRSRQEYASGHVPGAKLFPLQEIRKHLSEIPANTTVFVICQSGGRSSSASSLLAQNGINNVNNVAGGTSAWSAAGFPLER